MAERLVLDASALVDVLLANDAGARVVDRISGYEINAPAHLDAEVISTLARLVRGGLLSETQIDERLEHLTRMPIARHDLPPLLAGAWSMHQNLRILDALYVELAGRLDTIVLTTDRRLARAHRRAEAA